MTATVPHVTSGLGLGKFQADGFLLTRVYMYWLMVMVQKCFVKLLNSVFLCTHFMNSNPFLRLPFYVTYTAVLYLQLTYY